MLRPYQRLKISLATKHGKEDAIEPHFREHLGAEVFVPEIDTDALGTFSAEVERRGDALKVAEKKARLGMKASGLRYGIASEGSFGPHPVIPFGACETELMVFVDDVRNFKLHEVILSVETNYNQACVTTLGEADDFLRRAQFPSHAVIVRPNEWADKRVIFKAIQDEGDLKTAFARSRKESADGKVWIETDMRAHVNPSRMKVISLLAEQLARRLATPCPVCESPGWGRTGVEHGLVCEYCEQPTDMVAFELFGCTRCEHAQKLPRSDGLKEAPQMQCGWCNP